MSRHGLTRRETIQLLTTGAAMVACSQGPRGEIVPWVRRPEDGHPPGVPRAYATARVEDGYAIGLVATSREGRPTRVDGNPLHPASLGGTGPREQASILGLYDPNRAREVRRGQQPATIDALRALLAAAPEDGAGWHVLMAPTSSLVHERLVGRLRARRPAIGVHTWAPVDREPVRAGATLAFGQVLEPVARLDAVDVLVAIDADPIGAGPARLRHARELATTRRDPDRMSRIYVIEPGLTLTGAKADHRLPARATELPSILAAIGRRVLADGPLRQALARFPDVGEDHRRFVDAAADALATGAVGRRLLLVGEHRPAWEHAVAAVVNDQLGAPVSYVPSPVLDAGSHGLGALLAALDAGAVDTLLILGANPAYGAPGDLRAADRLRRARRIVVHGLYEDETAALADWFCPDLHELERWGDARAFDGTLTLQQPLIEPLYDGHSAAELLQALIGDEAVGDRQLLEAVYGPSLADALRQGLLPGSALPPVDVPANEGAVAAVVAAVQPPEPSDALELVVRPSPRVYDGRDANNPWLQELPDPFTKQSWGSAAKIGPLTASALGLEDGDVVRIRRGQAEITTAVIVASGLAERTIAMELGYGRDGEEVVAAGIGADTGPLRSAADPWHTVGVELQKVGRTELALTQRRMDRHERHVARQATPGELAAERVVRPTEAPRLYTPDALAPHRLAAERQWAMAVDLATCIGCQACVVACQSENNVPVVGEEQVRRGRAMYWLRIDRYDSGPETSPETTFQPMMCQHCETAPCEYVCPVEATVHSPDGLNEQVYNRCVGTRFCSNNCPYKVRRFNWLDYTRKIEWPRTMQLNPEVTVRERGVMEKCTFCVQRIREGERRARVEGRELGPMDIRTACQQACPTEAIVFGDKTVARTPLRDQWEDRRAYEELGELNTRPRVRYLVGLRNPDPALAPTGPLPKRPGEPT